MMGLLFASTGAKYETATTPEDVAVGESMNAYWAAFARTGDPNGEGRPKWPAYSAAPDVVMDFTATGANPLPDPRRARLDIVY
jgi:para-nitrobenzyl esterase